jgi:DNA primase
MLSGRNKLQIITILDSTLGVGSSLKGNEQAHHCPFCNHHKKKLQINLDTQRWHCWVCDSKGRSIYSLLRKLNVDIRDLNKVRDVYGDEPEYDSKEEYVAKLQLPKEFKQLYFKPTGSFNPLYNQAIHYLSKRGIAKADIVKHNIGYCEDGLYGGRVIIPSYDDGGELNYFVARSFYEDEPYKYKNPPISRDVIVFENQINWNEPITLVEGVFDSFSVKRNVIPLLGKFLLSKLKNKIMERGVKEVTIMLDSDAVADSTKHTEWFINNGIKVRNIIPTDKDAGEMGFKKVNELLKDAKETGWDDLVLSKLNNI